MGRWRSAAAAAFVLSAGACGGGGYQDSYSVPPGSDPPPGSESTFTDAAGRLYALVASTAGGATLVVLAVHDGSTMGSLPFASLEPGGFAVGPSANVYVADRAAGVVHVVSPDGGFGDSTLSSPAPDAIAATATRVAIVSEDEVALSGVFEPLALPSGGSIAAASFSRDGSVVAIARNEPANVVPISIGPVVSIAGTAPLTSPDACSPSIDDLAFARLGNGASWYALDLACGHVFVGGVSQDSAATVVFPATGAPAAEAENRLAVDGWTDRLWLSDGAGVQVVEGGVASPVGGVPGATTSLALANAGTLAWVATTSSGGEAPTIVRISDAGTATPFSVVGSPGGSVRALEYLDRPPFFTSGLDLTAPDCGTSTFSFPVTVVDPDEDPVDVWWVPGYDGEDGSFDGETFTGTFSRGGGYGPDAYVRFEAMSGYYLAYAEIAIYVPRCESHDDDEDENDDGSGAGCACQCTVASPGGGALPGSSTLALAGIALVAFGIRRSHA